MALPTVAIVGRPNVGKSRLFNRLVGERRSIVEDRPGVTRDRILARAELDLGLEVQLIDTGGLVPEEEDFFRIREQVEVALELSDAIIFVADGTQGLTAADEEIAETLRKLGKPIVVAVNKQDVGAAKFAWTEFHALGFGDPVPVSAEHGTGILELARRLKNCLPLEAAPETQEERALQVALVGRPNVGKSSILNRLLGETRVLVSPVPGTTRDPVDTLVTRNGTLFRLVDTAGIRKLGRTADLPEQVAILLARRQLERSEVAVLVLEAPAGVTTGDLAVAGLIQDFGRASVVAVNQWDRLDASGRERLDRTWPRLAEVLHEPLRINVSARTGRGIERILPAVLEAHEAFSRKISTSDLNELLREILARHNPPTLPTGRPWRCYYATQVSTAPPTFLLFVNEVLPVGHAYRRYLQNRLREALQAPGIPIRLVLRARRPGKLEGSVGSVRGERR
jgi:GTP-binding protein